MKGSSVLNNRSQSEDIYRTLFNNMLNCVACCRMIFKDGKPEDFVFQLVNNAFAVQTGLKDVVGKKVTEIVPGIRQADPELFERLAQVALTGKSERFEILIHSLQMWLLVSAFSPQEEHFVATFDVITERKRAEEAHRQAEERYRRVIEGSDQSFWDWNLKSNEFRVSPRFESMLGYEYGELPGHEGNEILISPESWSAYIHPDDLAKAWESIEKHLKEISHTHEVEVRCRTKAGKWIWILTKGRVVAKDKDGSPLIMSGSFTVITQRKQAKEALRRSEERFRLALTNSQVTVFEQDLELRYSYNQRPYLGYSPEEVLGKRDRDLLETNSAIEIERVKQSVIDTGASVRKEMSAEALGKPKEYFDLYVEPRQDESGKVIGIICTAVDITERKIAQQALERSEARFRQLANAMPQLVWTAEPDGTVDYYNDRLQQYGSVFSRNMEGVFEWMRIVHPDDVDSSVRAWEHAIKVGTAYEIEQRVLRADGNYRWHISRAVPVRNEHNLIIKWFGTSTDIHDLKTAQETARRNEERLLLAQQVAHIGTFEWDFRTNEHMWSEELEAIHGLPPGGFDGEHETWLSCIHPEDRARVKQLDQQAMATGELKGEWRVVWPDGTVRWVASRGKVFKDKEGNLLRMVGINIDITEQKESEARLRESEARFRALLDGISDAYVVHDFDGRIVEVNSIACASSGYLRQDLLQMNICDLMLSLNLKDLQPVWSQAHAHEEPINFIARVRRKDGTDFPVEVRINTLVIGGQTLFLGLARDITEREQTEQERNLLSGQRQLALDSARLGWWHYDVATDKVAYDERYGQICGFSGETLGVESILARTHPDDRAGLLEKIHAALSPGDPQPYEIEVRLVLDDGSVRWIQAHGIATFEGIGASRRATSMVGTVADITAQHQAQEDIRESEMKYRALFEHSPDAIFLTKPDGRILEANAAACSMLGMSQEEIIRRGRQGFVEDTPALQAALEVRARTGIMPATEMTYIRKDGARLAVEATSVIFGSGPDKLRSLIIARDITERIKNKAILIESEEKYRTLVESAADAYFVHDLSGRLIEVNRMACESLGYTREELLGLNVFADIEQDVNPEQAKEIASSLNPGQVITLQGHHRHKDGHVFPVEVRVNFFIIGAQKLFISLVRDIAERQKMEEKLKLAAAVYQDSSEAMMVLDENRNIIMVNQAFTDIFGYESDEVIGRHPRFLRIGQPGDAMYVADDDFYQSMWRQADETGRAKGEIWHKRKDGQFIAVQHTLNVVAGESVLPHRYVTLLSDITEKKRSDDLIWSQANFDTLTGLPNRRFFRDRLEHEVRNARRSNLPLALLFIDLDGFKDVNDTLGHDMGDLLLKEAADRLYRCVRESDTVARLGGDEFTVILTELHDSRNVDRVAQHILHALAEPVKLGEELAYVSASIGITIFPNDANLVEDLIKNADQAMYAAKESGRNQCHYFTQAMQDAAIARMRLINDLRVALEGNQFKIEYQPIVEMATGKIHKAEALIRWRHPVQGLINPMDFISAAEDAGMITAFGNWVFREAARQTAAWRERYHSEFQISVNISPVQFKKEGINPAIWFDHMNDLGLPGKGVVIEITEGLLLDGNPKVMDQLLMLRDAGIEVALDDFGTGYSSLSYLQRFDIDYIKIDQAFVRNLAEDSNDMVLCEAMIVMAHKMNIRVIAEGVETSRQNELLANSGCDFAQGYLYSRPVPVDQFERLLESDPFSFQESLNI